MFWNLQKYYKVYTLYIIYLLVLYSKPQLTDGAQVKKKIGLKISLDHKLLTIDKPFR